MTVRWRTDHGPTGPRSPSDRAKMRRRRGRPPRATAAGTLSGMAIRFYVGHGASGSAASMAAHVAGLVARGIDAVAIDLPVKKAEEVVGVFRTIVPDRPADQSLRIAVGGQSYGGRVASLAAAEPDTTYAALVLFSYPLHPPGRPERAAERTSHWRSIRC